MRKITLILGISFWLCTGFLQPCTAQDKQEINVSEIIFGHIEDAYEWHITDINGHSLHIPLPIIVKSSTGWHFFSSDRLHHGATYKGLYIAPKGPYTGKIVERNAAKDETRPLDLSMTKNVVGLLINSLILVGVMLSCARWYKRHDVKKTAPKGGVGMMEAVIVFVYEEVIRDNIRESHRRYTPYLLTVFFFILINNLMGLVPFFPGGANITGNIAVTMVLALCTFIMINLYGTKEYWKDVFWPHVPTWLKAPLPIMPVIEFFGLFTKPFALMIRLFANILAGHAIILSIVSIIFITASLGPALNGSMTFVAVLFGFFMNMLEVMVAFIQAYVFTLLSAVFIGLSQIKEEMEPVKKPIRSEETTNSY